MSLLLLEAFGALVLLVLIVWWTMFLGRKNGELPSSAVTDETKSETKVSGPANEKV